MKHSRTPWLLLVVGTFAWASGGCSSKASSSDAATSVDAAGSTGANGGMVGPGGATGTGGVGTASGAGGVTTAGGAGGVSGAGGAGGMGGKGGSGGAVGAAGAGGSGGVGGASGTGGSGSAGRSTATDAGADAAGGAGGARGIVDTLVCPGETQGTWVAMSTTSAPRGTTSPGMVWTGTELYIYSGYDAGLFDPCANTWQSSPTATARLTMSVPAANEFLFFAPAQFQAFDYRQNLILPLSLAGASQASYPTVVPAGAKLIEWGGWIVSSAPDAAYTLAGTQTGAIYDLATDAWTATSTKGAPAARMAPGAWTGSQLAIWGGHSADTSLTDARSYQCSSAYDYVNKASGCVQYGDGALYDPARDAWRPMAATGAPKPRFDHLILWTGDRVLVWGGGEQGVPDPTLLSSGEQCLNDGGLYDPVAQTWTTMAEAPPSLGTQLCLGGAWWTWTGDYLAIGSYSASGSLYDPHSNSWSTLDPPGPPGTDPIMGCEAALTAQAGALVAVCTVNSVRMVILRLPGDKAWRSYPLPSDLVPSTHVLWTGRRLFVWGGTLPSTYTCPPPSQQPGCDPPPPSYTNKGYMLVP